MQLKGNRMLSYIKVKTEFSACGLECPFNQKPNSLDVEHTSNLCEAGSNLTYNLELQLVDQCFTEWNLFKQEASLAEFANECHLCMVFVCSTNPALSGCKCFVQFGFWSPCIWWIQFGPFDVGSLTDWSSIIRTELCYGMPFDETHPPNLMKTFGIFHFDLKVKTY